MSKGHVHLGELTILPYLRAWQRTGPVKEIIACKLEGYRDNPLTVVIGLCECGQAEYRFTYLASQPSYYGDAKGGKSRHLTAM